MTSTGLPSPGAQPGIADDLGHSDPVQSAVWASIYLSAEDAETFLNRLRLLFAHTLFGLIYVLLLLIAIVLTAITLGAPAGSFSQVFFLEVSSGIATFLVAPIFLAVGRRYRLPAYLLLLIMASGAGYAAQRTSGLSQGYLIEACVGLLLLLALDLAFKSLETSARAAIEAVKARQNQHLENIDAAEDAVAPQFYALDGGTMKETRAFEQVRRYLRVCAILASDEPCREPDMIDLIVSVNRLKSENKDEYLRARAWAEAYPEA